MKPHFDLTDEHINTCHAPLCVVSYALRGGKTLDGLLGSELISMQSRKHGVGEKLIDAFLVIVAGLPSLYLLNQHLRPDRMLAASWGREQLAEQSSVSRVLDAFDPAGLGRLRQLAWGFWQAHSQLPAHDWRQPLVLDLDLTPLRASRHAEGSTKGYLGKKMRRVVNWLALWCIRTTSRCFRSCIQAGNIVPTPCNRR